MKVGKQSGEWKKLAQAHAEKQATKTARSVWAAFWKRYDRERRTKKR